MMILYTRPKFTQGVFVHHSLLLSLKTLCPCKYSSTDFSSSTSPESFVVGIKSTTEFSIQTQSSYQPHLPKASFGMHQQLWNPDQITACGSRKPLCSYCRNARRKVRTGFLNTSNIYIYIYNNSTSLTSYSSVNE